jgi:hypothetical protein
MPVLVPVPRNVIFKGGLCIVACKIRNKKIAAEKKIRLVSFNKEKFLSQH